MVDLYSKDSPFTIPEKKLPELEIKTKVMSLERLLFKLQPPYIMNFAMKLIWHEALCSKNDFMLSQLCRSISWLSYESININLWRASVS